MPRPAPSSSPRRDQSDADLRGLDNVFRVVGRDDQQGTIAGNYLADRWGDKSIAIVHDGETYGRGLAEETKRQLNARGVQEALFTEIMLGNADYGELVAELSAIGADVAYYGGYAPEAGLIIRQARAAGDDVQLVVGDGVASEDFWLVAGPAGAGMLVTTVARCSGEPGGGRGGGSSAPANFEPLGGSRNGHATIEVWAQAVEQASLRTQARRADAAQQPVRHGVGHDRLRRERRRDRLRHLPLVPLEGWPVCARGPGKLID